jgi:hypothetical protein
MKNRTFAVTVLVAVFSLGGLIANAEAGIIYAAPNADFSGGSYTLNLANNAANYTFSDTGNLLNAVAVQTAGDAKIASVFGAPTAYFTGSRAPFISGDLAATFDGYDSPTTIPFTGTDSYLALRLDLNDGFHYGYARVDGPALLSYGYQSTPGVGIQAGAQPTAAVPGPSSLGMLGFGLGLIGLALIRRRRATVLLKAL